MDIRRITEVGVAVRDLEQAISLFRDLLGAEVGPATEVPRYGMRFCMCRVGKVDFELMAPTGEAGVIAEFLEKRGQGLHHVGFAVDDVEDTMRTLGGKGMRFVDEAPIGADLDVVDYAGRAFSEEIRFAFSHPASLVGILLEFIEYPNGYETP